MTFDGLIFKIEVTWQDPQSYRSIDEFASAMTRDVERTAKMHLVFEKVVKREQTDYVRLELAVSHPLGKKQPTSVTSDNLTELTKMLGVFLAKEKGLSEDSIHSIRYLGFGLADAILLVIKVNWRSYKGENEVTLWGD